VSRPLGSAPTPVSKGFVATTGRSAGGRRHGTQCLWLLPRHAPCRGRGALLGPFRPVPVSALAFSRSVQEQQTRLTPPLRRAPPGPYTGTCQACPEGKPEALGFDAVQSTFDASTTTPLSGGCSGTSSWSLPDASRAPFPSRSPRRSSANAAEGGLTPAPVGRRRRACLHLLHSTASKSASYTAPPSAFVTHEFGGVSAEKRPKLHQTRRPCLKVHLTRPQNDGARCRFARLHVCTALAGSEAAPAGRGTGASPGRQEVLRLTRRTDVADPGAGAQEEPLGAVAAHALHRPPPPPGALLQRDQ
jgi:hypothetical protein